MPGDGDGVARIETMREPSFSSVCGENASCTRFLGDLRESIERGNNFEKIPDCSKFYGVYWIFIDENL